jgi:hypothetical protein
MTPDQYLQAILDREAVDTGLNSPLRKAQVWLAPTLQKWGGRWLGSVHPSGSFMKGTANKSGTDIDLFISLSEDTAESLEQIHDTLFNALTEAKFTPKRQNVSLNIKLMGQSVDLVPGKRQNAFLNDHSLYRSKADTWTKTNVITHINHVAASPYRREIRILKLWRDQKNLDFPSFYLELTVMKALAGQSAYFLSQNVQLAFDYLRDSFAAARVVDPANTNNIISDDLTIADKQKISAAAKAAREAPYWSHIVQ